MNSLAGPGLPGGRSVVEDDPDKKPVPLHPVIGMGYGQDLEWLRSPGQADVPVSGPANLDPPVAGLRNWAHCSIIGMRRFRLTGGGRQDERHQREPYRVRNADLQPGVPPPSFPSLFTTWPSSSGASSS